MRISRLKLKNWRNFLEVDVPLQDTTYLIGANAVGKSNFMDALRFLRDVGKTSGGGLQKAIEDRGGIALVKCLHARRDQEVRIEVFLEDGDEKGPVSWRYALGFKPAQGNAGALITQELAWRNDELLIKRPYHRDRQDPMLLTQTHLEQIQANASIRPVAAFFGALTYLHLVPQLLKFGERIGGQRLENDPFGQGFLERVAKAPKRIRDSRLRRIEAALKMAVPSFDQLRFEPDRATGQPHLEARYVHHRPHAGWQRESHLSDGTLRLIALFWSLLEGDSLLLLEEPELSLHEAVVEQIPLLLHRMQRQAHTRRQVIVSTHSEAMLRNAGIPSDSILLALPAQEGSTVRTVTEDETIALDAGLSPAEVVLPKTRPSSIEQMTLL